MEKQENTESSEQAQATAPAPPSNLFDRQCGIYAKSMKSDLNKTLERFGFAFFHSLPPEERVMFEEKLGLEPDSAVDFFNLGTAYAMQEDYAKAEKLMTKALEMDPELLRAVFNLGVLYEKQNKKDKARQYYEQYMGMIEDEEEKKQIEQHLSEI